jgi:RHS repeat-associated protein
VNTEAGSFTNLYGDWNGLSVRLSNAALTEERAFDILDRMTNLVYRNASAAIVGSFKYRYDVLGLVTQKIAFVASGATVTNFYAYDKIGRLTNEITRSGSTTTTRFTYDLAGNRLTAGATTYTYANNRLNGALHDTAGNITNLVRGTTTLRMSWNTQGQLTSVTTNNALAESYAYDPLGRRVKTTTGGATVYHVYQGDECAADLDSSGNPLRSYTFGQGIDNLLAMTVYSVSATNTYYAVKDHLGSVQALVNAAGSVVESYSYDAWGNTTIKNAGGTVITASAYGNRYMFQGREYSTVTGLYNFRARWYAPTIGRWLSKDPIGLEGGLNLYAFCGNDAVNFVDPMGEIVILSGSDAENKVILDALGSFVRGTISIDSRGKVSRAPSPSDGAYEKTFDELISSSKTYSIMIDKAADLYGGGSFDPNGCDGGTIRLSPTQGGYYQNIHFVRDWRKFFFEVTTYFHTHASILAHELGHAISNMRNEPNSDRRLPAGDKNKRALEASAWKSAEIPYERLNMPIP